MNKPKQITFRTLFIQTLIAGVFVALLQYFWLDNEPTLGKTAIYFFLFWIIYLGIMCGMYRVNPFKRKFQSPYKD